MYNTSFKCSYMTVENLQISNETYQNELLSVFGFSSYSDKLPTRIQELYHTLNYSEMKDILKNVPFYLTDPEMLFMVLFSYDYFKYTHDLICKILTKQDTTNYHDELITILKK